MKKKKEYKKPLLAGGDDDDDDYDTDDGDITEALTAATSAYSLDITLGEDEAPLAGDDGFDVSDTGESFQSASSMPDGSGHKRVSRARTSQRRSMNRLSQSPGTLNGRTRRRASDRKLVASPGAISRKSAADRTRSPGALSRSSRTASPGALSRKSVNSANTTSPGALSGSTRNLRAASNSPHHLRRGPRARRRGSVESNDTSPKLDESSGHNEGGSARLSKRKTLTKLSPQQSIRNLFAGHASTDDMFAPDLDDDLPDDDAANSDKEPSESFDDAEVVRDELADLEGMLQAAKVK